MIHVAIRMLLGDRAKYGGLIFGITFTSFLVTFAASYFTGFMTQGFALINENGAAQVWVMDQAVSAVDQTTNMPSWALARVRSVQGVQSAVPLLLGTAEARFPNGRIQSFQVIGVDDATLYGVPPLKNKLSPLILRSPDAVIVDPGGTTDKLGTPQQASDRWPRDGLHLDVPMRDLTQGDDLLVNDHRVVVAGLSQGLARYPPRPLLYTTRSNATRLLLAERNRLTFVLVTGVPGLSPNDLAARIEAQTGLRARSASDFKQDTVRWILINSEDVGDITAMLTLAMSVGLGVTGVMLYMFTQDHLRQYAVLSAMGATPRLLLSMIFTQAGVCGAIGTGLGIGLCAIVGETAATTGYPFRMMWFTPLFGGVMVIVVCLAAALVSARPVMKLQPAVVFSTR